MVARLNAPEPENSHEVEVMITANEKSQLEEIAAKMGLPPEEAMARLVMDELAARVVGKPVQGVAS